MKTCAGGSGGLRKGKAGGSALSLTPADIQATSPGRGEPMRRSARGWSALVRCSLVGVAPLLQGYHDSEWGVPVHDDGLQFEFLVLESFQAGLSWLTVLKKRERFREPSTVRPRQGCLLRGGRPGRLLRDEGIIRNEQRSGRRDETPGPSWGWWKEGSFSRWLWSFVEGEPIVGGWDAPAVPSETPCRGG